MVTLTPPMTTRYFDSISTPSETEITLGERGGGGGTSMLTGSPSARPSQ
jgi:hypothetical protein